MLNEESRQCLYQEYMATGIKVLAEAYVRVHGGNYELPSFIEMTHPQPKETAEQVISHLKKIFS